MVIETRVSTHMPVEARIYETLSSVLSKDSSVSIDAEREYLTEQLSKAVKEGNESLTSPIITVFRIHGNSADVLMLRDYTEIKKANIGTVAKRAILEIESREENG
ncbi:MAG: hypothetical protein AAB521_04910 [Patescibacteria group bacterium]